MKYSKKLTAALAMAASVALGGNANADTFTGFFDDGLGNITNGDGVSWEDPNNWLLGEVPLNNGSGNTLIAEDDQVVFDADSFAAVLAAGNTQNGSEYRIARLLMGDETSGATNGTHSFTLDQGPGITVRITNGSSAVISGRVDKFSTLNLLSGITNIEGGRVRVGQGPAPSSGTINLSGGELICGRGGLELGNPNNIDGDGTLNITGGASLSTRNDVEVFTTGVFHVSGSGSVIGIGSSGTTDGSWAQAAGGILRIGLDGGGFTPILIDDVDDDGLGLQGNATFEAGSILDPYDAGGAPLNVFTTVMTWEGTLTDNGLALSAAAMAAGWEMQIVGNELQVQLTGSPVIKGDVDMDGDVDFADIPEFISVLQSGMFQAEADCDCGGTVGFEDIPAFILILQGG